MTPRLDGEREAFEAWFRKESHERLCRNMPDKSYNDPTAHAMWSAWQACAALSASKHGGKAEEEWPTKEMVAAGLRRMLGDKQYSAPWEDVIYNMFRDMLAAAPPQTPQAAGAIDARGQGTIETPFGTYPADAWDAFEKHRIAQGLVLGMPGLKARPAFMAGWDAALASREEGPPAAQPPTPWVSVSVSEEFMTVDNYDARGVPNGRYRLTAPPAAGAAQAVNATLVYGALSDQARQRTSRENIEDVLAALAATPAPEGDAFIGLDQGQRDILSVALLRFEGGQAHDLDKQRAAEMRAALKAAHPGVRKEGE